MSPAPEEFQFRLGLTMEGVTAAAHRYEARPDFKTEVIAELTDRFSAKKWRLLSSDPVGNGLGFDEDTGHVDGGELRNWVNGALEFAETDLQVGEEEDSSCYYDTKGCWWKVRSYPLEEEDEETGEAVRYTAAVASDRYVERINAEGNERIARSTAEELASMGYRLTVTWRVCPPEDGQAAACPPEA